MAKSEKWMQHIKKSGELRAYFGIKEGDTIPDARLNALINKLKGMEHPLSDKNLKLLKQAIAAKNMREAREN